MVKRGSQTALEAATEPAGNVWGFDSSTLDVQQRLKRLVEQWEDQSHDEAEAWNEFFGPLLTDEEVQQRLGLTSPRDVDWLVNQGKLLALPTRDRELRYPAFQLSKSGGVYPEIERIIAIFAGVVATPYTIASWLRGPKDYLAGQTPIRWLEMNRDPDSVLAGAEVAAARLAR